MILVVDDEDAVRSVAARVLRTAGYQVLEACGGGEALELLERNAGSLPDLVLTDLVMPNIDGWELGDAIAARHRSLPVLYMTGSAKGEISRHGRSAEGRPLLRKPFAVAELVAAVRQILATGMLGGEAL